MGVSTRTVPVFLSSTADRCLNRIEHVGKTQKKVKAGKKAMASAPSALMKVFSRDDQHHGEGAKEGEQKDAEKSEKKKSESPREGDGEAGASEDGSGRTPSKPTAEAEEVDAGGSGKEGP